MKVIAGEVGTRPFLLTKARRFAPQGMQVLADVLENLDFADLGSLVLDWSNVLELQPADAVKPVLIIEAIKFVGDKRLTVQVRLDVDDLFGNDELIADDLYEIINSIKNKMLSELEANRDRLN